jgi:hypothetical protein
MRNWARVYFLGLAAFATTVTVAKDRAKTDDEIKQELIKESIAAYPGTCACPYNVDRAGHHCGRRSAYSRPGGYAPLCYPNDVTEEMVKKYRKEHGE